MIQAEKDTIEFVSYLAEIPTCDNDRLEYISRQCVACYDLINYSAKVCDLDSPVMQMLDRAVLNCHTALRRRYEGQLSTS